VRILFWSSTFWPNIGGVELLAAKLLPAMQARGYEFVVIASKNHADQPDETHYKDIPLHRFPFQHSLTEKNIDQVMQVRQKVAALKRAFAPHLVHINAVGAENFFHLTTTGAHRAPSLVTLHGKWWSQADAIVADTLTGADWVVGCSAAILAEGRRLAPDIGHRSSIIYNGVESPRLAPEPPRFDAPRLLCLGRLVREKGFDLALTAFGMLRGRFPRARLIIAGDGLARAELEKQALEQGISQAVDFAGWIPPHTVPALINSSTIVVMPSREDSLPLVALEGAAMARPIVGTRVGGLPEIVAHQESGLLVEKEDSRSLAEAISFLLENPDMAVQMGLAGQMQVQRLFTWQRHIDAYDHLYRSLVGRNGDVV
jgi:glycogen(starch) synthase